MQRLQRRINIWLERGKNVPASRYAGIFSNMSKAYGSFSITQALP
ncbi:hypothetical protein KT99_15445 [Shewanella benthica KT99]|uniref:Uncharacterized protein n=1 Tax=Shewanella benthica KT99 TaxID=314608 RepID=A9D4I1_9GAMM|nr:hypothetical protein KT99_15445 [Shewanella benthica KT99]